eukprot:TRINITY_DN2606_c0_g4_i4.p1 TRINITY_DN2606_c0_g4~~TRINITY_DN2606_c0_g4_i4.p1  ORF type:complete len:179 (+),score=24.45 TRINITY_DN2606_c0_g4_i4:56-592(+)
MPGPGDFTQWTETTGSDLTKYKGNSGAAALTADLQWRRGLRPKGSRSREIKRELNEEDVPPYMRHTQVSVNKDKTVVSRKKPAAKKAPTKNPQPVVNSWENLRSLQEDVKSLEQKVLHARAEREARMTTLFGPRTSTSMSPIRHSRFSLPHPYLNQEPETPNPRTPTDTDTPSKSVMF